MPLLYLSHKSRERRVRSEACTHAHPVLGRVGVCVQYKVDQDEHISGGSVWRSKLSQHSAAIFCECEQPDAGCEMPASKRVELSPR